MAHISVQRVFDLFLDFFEAFVERGWQVPVVAGAFKGVARVDASDVQ